MGAVTSETGPAAPLLAEDLRLLLRSAWDDVAGKPRDVQTVLAAVGPTLRGPTLRGPVPDGASRAWTGPGPWSIRSLR